MNLRTVGWTQECETRSRFNGIAPSTVKTQLRDPGGNCPAPGGVRTSLPVFYDGGALIYGSLSIPWPRDRSPFLHFITWTRSWRLRLQYRTRSIPYQLIRRPFTRLSFLRSCCSQDLEWTRWLRSLGLPLPSISFDQFWEYRHVRRHFSKLIPRYWWSHKGKSKSILAGHWNFCEMLYKTATLWHP